MLLQTSSAEAFTRLQQTIGLIAVNIGVAVSAFLLILKTYNDIKLQLKQTKQTAKELLNSKEEIVGAKEEIVAASDRNYKAIKENTTVTEKQAIEIQKHIVSRVRQEMSILSQRIGHIEAKLSTDDDGNAPTTALEREDE